MIYKVSDEGGGCCRGAPSRPLIGPSRLPVLFAPIQLHFQPAATRAQRASADRTRPVAPLLYLWQEVQDQALPY